MDPRPRIRDQFPYPIALPYSLTFEPTLLASERLWSLCFTQYQVLRVVALAHISQYLREKIDATAEKAVKDVNESIAGLRSPMFSNWLTAVRTLPRQWPTLTLPTLFAPLDGGLERLKKAKAIRSVGQSGNHNLDPLEAIVALRNSIAHGGLPDQTQAEDYLAEYVPVLHEVLDAFDFLAECTLFVCDDAARAAQGLPVTRRTLRGATPAEPEEVELSAELEDAFCESTTVLVTPTGKALPLDPLLRPLPHDEPLYLYDGHYGIRVGSKNAVTNRYVYYLGVRDKRSETPESTLAAERLRVLLEGRKINYDLPKERVAPWSIHDAALDYSRRTLTDLLGRKYFPECYEPFPGVDEQLQQFLSTPERDRWTDTERPRYRNGLLLLGAAGTGKTALLARTVERLLDRPTSTEVADPEHDRGNPNMVLFLRGDGIALRPEGMSLYRDVAEKLGVKIDEKGIGSFDELFAHLHPSFMKDALANRRLVLVFDALNEAPFAEEITREALQLIALAARYPWCKVIVATRDEWLAILPDKMAANEADPRVAVRPYLFDPNPEQPDSPQRLPALTLAALTPDHAERVYGLQQELAHRTVNAERPFRACPTPWQDLPAALRQLLTNPLYLTLFQAAFANRPVRDVTGIAELYGAYVESAYERNLGPTVRAVVDYLCADPDRATADLTDDDVNTLREQWNTGRTKEEIRASINPVEMLVLEGFVTKRIREEGGGYRFVYQTVAEYLLYRELRGQRPRSEDEDAYWRRLAKRAKVFPEYEGAFLFLLRDWERRDDARPWIGQLVDGGKAWCGPVLTKLLDELARTDFVPGQVSVRGARLATLLTRHETTRIRDALGQAGFPLTNTYYAPTATAYYQAASAIAERLHATHPGHVDIANVLAMSLNNLGMLLRADGRVAEVETAYRRSLEIREELYRQNPDHVGVTEGLAKSLNNFANLLAAAGKVREAEAMYRRSIHVYEELLLENPGHIENANGLALSLNNLGSLLRSGGRVRVAETVYRRSVEVYEQLLRQNLSHIETANGLARSLNNLGHLLRAAGAMNDAETAFRRSVQTLEELYRQNPDHVEIAKGLAVSLNSLGLLLSNTNQMSEAESMYRRSVQVSEDLYRKNPNHYEIAEGLAQCLSNLGVLLRAVSATSDAEAVYRRCIQSYEELHHQNPNHIDVASGLAWALNNLGVSLRAAGTASEAETMFRRSIQVYEALHHQNPSNIGVAGGFAASLNNFALLLLDTRRAAEAETVYRRSVAMREKLHRQSPSNVLNSNGLAVSLNNLGTLLRDVDQMAEAEIMYRRSIQVYEELHRQSPSNVTVANGLALSLNNLGVLLVDTHATGEAEGVYRRSIQVYEELLCENPGHVEIVNGLARSLNNLGLLLRATNSTSDAEILFLRSVQTREELYRQHPNNIEVKVGFAGSLCDVKRWAEAEKLLDEVLAVWPQHHDANRIRERMNANRKRKRRWWRWW